MVAHGFFNVNLLCKLFKIQAHKDGGNEVHKDASQIEPGNCEAGEEIQNYFGRVAKAVIKPHFQRPAKLFEVIDNGFTKSKSGCK